jgi:hypothetical protein
MRRVSSSSRAVPRSDIHAILTPEGHMDFAKYFQRDPRSLRGSFCTACQDSHGPWIPRSDHRRSFLNRNGGTCGISSRSSLFTMTFTPCPGDPSLRVPSSNPSIMDYIPEDDVCVGQAATSGAPEGIWKATQPGF